MTDLLVVATTVELDSRDLIRALERALGPGVCVAGAAGLLGAGGAEDGTVRDHARARGAIVVVVAPAGPDLANHALLTVEAARATGLAVAAVVVAGHGAEAQRAQIAERGVVDVVGLPDPQTPSAAVAGWPLGEWLAAEPVSATGGVALAPYTPWESRPVPDPRSAGREIIGPVLLEIIATEGPVLASRAYRLYNKASGGKALTTIARAPLSGSAYRLRQAGAIQLDSAPAATGEEDELLWPADTAPVRVRELGPRTLDEVPQAELIALMRRLLAAGRTQAELPRATLDTYGLTRMTAKAEAALEQAAALAGTPA
ncbi:MAG: nuclear transport factor 2 family protein [Solirubrobacterales bacterium]|nr:nuclear transport factor 2 family protein [Solirubrobacterales bacterium]